MRPEPMTPGISPKEPRVRGRTAPKGEALKEARVAPCAASPKDPRANGRIAPRDALLKEEREAACRGCAAESAAAKVPEEEREAGSSPVAVPNEMWCSRWASAEVTPPRDRRESGSPALVRAPKVEAKDMERESNCSLLAKEMARVSPSPPPVKDMDARRCVKSSSLMGGRSGAPRLLLAGGATGTERLAEGARGGEEVVGAGGAKCSLWNRSLFPRGQDEVAASSTAKMEAVASSSASAAASPRRGRGEGARGPWGWGRPG